MRIPTILPALAILALTPLGAQSVLRTHSGASDLGRFGAAIDGRGDVTGDAVADLVVGAPSVDAGAGADQGRALVLSGGNGATVHTLTGTAAGDLFGSAVALAGDVNADGRADPVIGAPGRNAGAGTSQGEVRVFSGQTGGVLFTIPGAAAGDRFGESVAHLGDINADGRSDFAIGAPDFDGGAGADAGRVTIHSGLDASVLFTLDGAAAGDRFGAALAGAGDTDGDAIPDLGVGIPLFDGAAGADTGRVAIVSGATGLEIRAVEGSQAGARLGSSVAPGGDADNDNRRDVAAGAPLHDGAAGADSGRVQVISGRDGATVFAVEGAAAGDQLGSSVGGGGDVNGDGFDDVLAGAPFFDGAAGADSGRSSVLLAPTGAVLFHVEGTGAGDREGVVALIGDINGTGRADVASGAPLREAGGSDRGQVRLLGGDDLAASRSDSYTTASLPRAVAAADLDGDGDRDLVVATGSAVSVLWNEDHAGALSLATFGTLARTDVALSAGGSASSVAAGQLDADSAGEIVVGRTDGTIDVIDGSGSGVSTAFALTAASPVAVDLAAGPGSIDGVTLIGSGAAASVACAGAGTFVSAGFLKAVATPLTAPAVGAALVGGGAFQAVAAGDLDNDGNQDLVAANASAGASGGVHVLLGPAFAPAAGSPYGAGTPPSDVVLVDLDGDNVDDDVAVASLGFVAGGVRILPDYNAVTGFGATHDPGLVLARAVGGGNLDAAGGDDLAVLDGAGNLVRLQGWTGAAFATQTTTPAAKGAGVEVAVAQLTQGAPGLCDPDEIATVHIATDLANVWRFRRISDVGDVAGTGCPVAAPVAQAGVSGDPVVGAASLALTLSAASPFSMAFLVAQPNLPAGSVPATATSGACGYVVFGAGFVQFFTFTNAIGAAAIPAGLPNDPCLIGAEFAMQWGVLDGGPVLGALTLSDAIIVRIGEL